jgi:hypothetical protein
VVPENGVTNGNTVINYRKLTRCNTIVGAGFHNPRFKEIHIYPGVVQGNRGPIALSPLMNAYRFFNQDVMVFKKKSEYYPNQPEKQVFVLG